MAEEGDRDPLKRMNVSARLMGRAVAAPPDSPAEQSEVDRIVEEDQKLRERRAKLRAMKPWQRKKVMRDAQRTRLALRLPVRVVEEIRKVADDYRASPAAAITWLITIALRDVKASGVNPSLEQSRDLRNPFRVSLPPEWDGAKRRVAYDIDTDLKEQIDALRESYRCSLWSLVAWLVVTGLALHRAGEEPVVVPSTSLRYSFVLQATASRGRSSRQSSNDPRALVRRFLGDAAEEV